MSGFEPLHSAVNHVPIPHISVLGYIERDFLPNDVFSEETPTGHDHLRADRWSGSLDVEMTVRAPLIFGEQTEDDQSRPSVEVPIDAGRHPVVPGTVIKGMISHAYGLFTASRFRIFGSHAEALTCRSDPAEALSLLPGRICEYKGGLGVEILDGLGETGKAIALVEDSDVDRGGVSIQRDGHLTIRLNPGSTQPAQQQMFARFRNFTRHGSQIEAQLSRWQGEKGPECLMVTGVWVDDQLEEFFQISPHLNSKELNV